MKEPEGSYLDSILPKIPHFDCPHVPQMNVDADEALWQGVPSIELVDTATGARTRLFTTFQACWNDESLFVRFVCEDDRIVATMTEHDDPIYDEDVVELFVSETGRLDSYKEFELSPANVKFDAAIRNNLQGSISVDTGWHADGWNTLLSSVPGQDGRTLRTYVWELPFRNFEGGKPSVGDEWRKNAYRIDRAERSEEDCYSAWSVTGLVDFHKPERFGICRFV